MYQKPRKKNSDHLWFTWNYQHVCQLCSYSANIKAGYLATRIFPYNRDVFPDEEFLSSYVTERTAPLTDTATSNESNGKLVTMSLSRNHSPEPGPSKRTPAEINACQSTSLTPEYSRHFPEAAGRNSKHR
jgi:hypothetical protein